ncbi:hypothetical protein BaRGS_00006515, partial [Batillaria attramentaria]
HGSNSSGWTISLLFSQNASVRCQHNYSRARMDDVRVAAGTLNRGIVVCPSSDI